MIGKITYSSYAFVIIFACILGFLLYTEQLEYANGILIGLAAFIFTSAVLLKKTTAIKAIIFFAPISMPLGLGFLDIKLSFPTEYTTLLILLSSTFILINDEKYDVKILKHPLTLILASDLLITIVSTIFSTHPVFSIKRTILKFSFFLCYYIIFSHWMKKDSKRPASIFFLYASGLIIPIVLTLKQHFRYDFSVVTSFSMPQPYFSDHTIYGACLAFVIPFLVAWVVFKYKDRDYKFYLVLILTMLIIVAEFFSYSRAAWISLFCAFGFYILVRLNTKISYLIIGTLLVSTIVVSKFDSVLDNMRTDGLQKEETVGDHLGSVTNLQNDASNLERVNRWVCAVRMFQEKPLTGFGPGTYQYEYDQFQSVDYMTRISTHGGNRGHAHSEYLGALAENGIFGLINLIVLVFYSIHLALVNLKRYKHDQLKYVIIFGASGGLVTFFVHGLFNGFLDTEKMSILVLGALGILLNYDLEFKRGKS